MRRRLRLLTASLLVTVPAWGAFAEEKLSRLEGVQVDTEAEQVVVSIHGTLAPNFTSFTMQDPFRVVVDWAGSRLPEASADRDFDRGLVRNVRTKQFNSEAEKISRVTVELAQSTTYRVEAKGTTVRLVLDPVVDPLPAPAPEPVLSEAEDVEAVPAQLAVVEGPLTEPDVAVPSEVPQPAPTPVMVAVAPTPAPVPVPVAPVVAPTPAPAAPPAPIVVAVSEPEVPVVDAPVEPVAVVVAPEAPAPQAPVAAPPAPVEVAVAPTPPAPAPAPVVAPAPPTKPEVAAEPVRLATFTPPAREPAPAPAPVVVPAKIETPAFAEAQRPEARTQRLASAMPNPPMTTRWVPPALVHAERRRGLKIVKIASPQEALQPEGSTPAEGEDDVREARPAPTMPTSADANDFDPGPRVMKYIGFRQMADTSRIFVRMDGKARYRQSQEGDLLVIELIDTSVPVKNNTRALDTSYFNSPVLRVQAVPRGDNTRIEIRLREQGNFQVKRVGTTIAIDFSRAS